MFSGSEWTRVASVELLDPNGGPGLQNGAGLSIDHGLGSVAPPDTPKLPLRISFDESLGDSVMALPLFGDSLAASVNVVKQRG